MLIAVVVLMLVATIIVGISLCFLKKESPFFLLLKTLYFIALICFGFSCCAVQNQFNGFSILAIISILPLFFTLLIKTPSKDDKQIAPNQQPEQQAGINNDEMLAKKFQNKKATLQTFLKSGIYIASAFCLTFCSLYLGRENFAIFFVGLFLGIALIFLDFIIKKEEISDVWKFLEKLLLLSVGLLIASVFASVSLQFDLTTSFFALAMLTYSAHILLEIYRPNKYNHLLYGLSMILIFLPLIF